MSSASPGRTRRVDPTHPVPADSGARLNAAPPEAIAEAVQLVRSAQRPVVLADMHAGNPETSSALRTLIAGTELPVVETFQAAGVLSRELDNHRAGRVGVFRNLPGDVVMAHADLLVTVGYDEVEYDSAAWNTDVTRTIVHIDSLPARLGDHYQPTLELRGNVAATLRQLAAPLAGLRLGSEFRDTVDAQRRALSVAYARSLGAHGHRVSTEGELVDVLPRALAEPGPSAVGRRRRHQFHSQYRSGREAASGLLRVADAGSNHTHHVHWRGVPSHRHAVRWDPS
ncbi:hypothetical protein [Salinispora arenicola]|uniref:hypothetical protein n=1 Tax=Salinispora arenicola TaxID=168697 RepID=UPI00039D1E73|nr:hypothetical protein [Salinispora arenicola]